MNMMKRSSAEAALLEGFARVTVVIPKREYDSAWRYMAHAAGRHIRETVFGTEGTTITSKLRRVSALISMSVTGGLMCAGPASAAEIHAIAYNSVTNQNDSDFAFQGSVSASSSGAGATGSATGSAYATFGVNKAGATTSSTVVPGGPIIQPGAGGDSYWADELTINSSTVSGFIIASLDLNYSLNAALDGGYVTALGLGYTFTTANANAGFGPYYYRTETATSGVSQMSAGVSEIVQDLPSSTRRLVTLNIPFFSGVATYLASTLTCGAGATANGEAGSSASATCDAGHSAYWGGIIGVTDEQGNAISDYSLISTSGTDYSKSFAPTVSAVPEPTSWAMMIMGVGLAGGILRRQKRIAPALG